MCFIEKFPQPIKKKAGITKTVTQQTNGSRFKWVFCFKNLDSNVKITWANREHTNCVTANELF